MRLREREGVYSAIWPISLHSIYCLQLAERFSLYRERRARDSHTQTAATRTGTSTTPYRNTIHDQSDRSTTHTPKPLHQPRAASGRQTVPYRGPRG